MTTLARLRIAPKFHIPNITFTTPIKISLIGVGVGITIIGLLARYLKRRRRNVPTTLNTNKTWKKQTNYVKSPNGDISSYTRRSMSPAYPRSYLQSLQHGSVSLASDHQSSVSTIASTITLDATTGLTPQQFGLMGLEALETAIGYWEDALHSYTAPLASGGALAITNEEESEFSHYVEKVLDMACALQEHCEQLFLHQTSVLFRSDSTSERFVDVDRYTVTSISSLESFVSAVDVADLREFDEFSDLNQDFYHLPLYQAALRQLEEVGIPYRSLRTDHLKCQTDIDYLAKLYCIRLAFQFTFEDEKIKVWFIECGRQLISSLLFNADKDPKDFLNAYDEMLTFIKSDHHYTKTEEELKGRGVRCMTFYDIVLDFIFLDAFEDLENPPSSVLAVVQNRWLSNGFKETALATACWSVLKAKRRFLKFQNGFIAHFYDISEHTTPVLAWGFLGPEEGLKDLCNFFKDQVLGFLQDIFNSEKSRYSSVEDLSKSIMSHAYERYEITSKRLIP
uniref:Mitoguardin n=1 Tax=Strigamia maritima TaxID=126957 RepID=T1J7M5_STRMM